MASPKFGHPASPNPAQREGEVKKGNEKISYKFNPHFIDVIVYFNNSILNIMGISFVYPC